MHISKVLNGRNVHINFYGSDIRFVTKLPAPGLPLRHLSAGKVNQSAGNLRHFPLENIDSTAIFAGFSGESAQNFRKFTLSVPDSVPDSCQLSMFQKPT